MGEPAKCPHCLRPDSLAPVDDTHDDTAGATVRVWRCSACGYSEGRPDEPAAPATA